MIAPPLTLREFGSDPYYIQLYPRHQPTLEVYCKLVHCLLPRELLNARAIVDAVYVHIVYA